MRFYEIFIFFSILFMACQSEDDTGRQDEDIMEDSIINQPRKVDSILVSDTISLFPEDSMRGEDNQEKDKSGTSEKQTTRPSKNWTVGKVRKNHDVKGVSIITAIRVGSHSNFERLVIEFEEAIPSYKVEYIEEPFYQCGSGHPLTLTGDGLLHIKLTYAMAHNKEGRTTVQRSFRPVYPIIKEMQLGCDFEGMVSVLVGMSAPNAFSVMEFRNPSRLVVDIRR